MNETKRDGIQLLSDLYLHRGNPLPWFEEDAVFVIVAGNLAPIQQPRCLRAAAAQWGKAKILYVPGPVEFHMSEIDAARATLAEECQRVGVTLLDPGAVTIGGVRFIGATLWTDFKLCGSAKELEARRAAEATDDFRSGGPFDHGIRHGTGQLTAEATVRRHGEDRRFIEHELALAHRNRLETVVITHHAPTVRSIPSWLRGHPLSAASASNLNRVIRRYQPTMWIHGHVGYPISERIDETWVVANPHGRTRTTNTSFAPDYVVGI